MPFDLILSEIPSGYSLSSARPGEKVNVAFREFLSSEDGDDFIRRLEGFPNAILSQLPPAHRPRPSQIDHLLIIIRRDQTATVYINELSIVAEMMAKRNISAGEVVSEDDIADIRTVKFEGVEIPANAGFMYVFSVGWRKGVFYDFAPLHPEATESRDFDVAVQLGQFLAYLIFQDRLKISEPAWNTFFAQSWFPFIGLRNELVRELANYALEGWNIDDLVPKISQDVEDSCDRWKAAWSQRQFFADHIEVLSTAIERFRAGDYVSTVAILYPRIEGVLRSYHLLSRPGVSQRQESLVETATSTAHPDEKPRTLLLPEKFRRYLTDVYFRSFDPQNPQGVSRHTVAHGVAPSDAFSQKAALVGLLILDQLSYYFASEMGHNPSFRTDWRDSDAPAS